MTRTLLLAVGLLTLRCAASAAVMTVSELTDGTLTIDGRPAKAGQKVPPGKVARLSRGATLVLDVDPWGKALFHGPAVFTTLGGEEDGVQLKAGGVLSVLKKVKGRQFFVRTPAAALAVRGTTFYAEARGATASYICLCDGSIEIESESGAYHSNMTSQHKHRSVLLRFANDQGLETEAPMQHHTDQEIESLGGEAAK
jgi:hypothetical protein